MHRGKIKWFNDQKGFGFISVDDGSNDIFLHINQVKRGGKPSEGDPVVFNIGEGRKGGREARDVIIEKVNISPDKVYRAKPSLENNAFFPYGFVRRKGGKSTTTSFHDQVKVGNFDIAFDVTWTTETPTALAACEAPGIPESAVNRDGENTGFNKRWLTVRGRLAISPFTVKGAVANAFANLMGGCFRVPDKEEGHSNAINASTYPYTGKWKRYRVGMSHSHAGIIREISSETGKIKIQPVIEYYLEEDSLPSWLSPGDPCQADWKHPLSKRNGTEDRNKRFVEPGTIRPLQPGQVLSQKAALIYNGPYRFGMDLELKPGDLNKHHHHRFYEENGGIIEGEIPLPSFSGEQELKSRVYAGQFCKGERKELKPGDPRKDKLGQAWYEDLSALKPGHFCYYTAFTDRGRKRIVAIGKNYQFKALFDHNDTVPQDNKTCIDKKMLCPRCALFGVADKSENKNEPVGYAGRFRSAALVSDACLREEKIEGSIPTDETLQQQKVLFSTWFDGERLVARQYALPILGSPKPSKRDQNGYFDKETGQLKGAKRYHHSALDFDNILPALIRETDQKIALSHEAGRPKNAGEKMVYSHKMRPVAPVCREGIDFQGTLGCENCTPEEAAGLLMLLDRRIAGHRFKIGLGKSRGMGTVAPKIRKIWVRDPANQQWRWVSVDISPDDNREVLLSAITKVLPGVSQDLELMCTVNNALYRADKVSSGHKEGKPDFPAPGLKYWQTMQIEVF